MLRLRCPFFAFFVITLSLALILGFIAWLTMPCATANHRHPGSALLFVALWFASPSSLLASPVSIGFSAARLWLGVSQLLGRAYYHALEMPIVYASAGVHVLAGAVKRLVLMRMRVKARRRREEAERSNEGLRKTASDEAFTSREPRVAAASADSTSPASQRSILARLSQLAHLSRRAFTHIFPLSSAGTWSAYALVPFLAQHVLLNRVVPSSNDPAIGGLSPAELDYAFVAHGLGMAGSSASAASSRWGWLNWAGYVALLSLGMAHVIYAGARLVRWSRWYVLPRRRAASTRSGDAQGGRLAATQRHEERQAILTSRESLSSSPTQDFRQSRHRHRDLRPGLWAASTTLLLACLVRLDHEGRQAAALGLVSKRLLERYQAVYRRMPWPY